MVTDSKHNAGRRHAAVLELLPLLQDLKVWLRRIYLTDLPERGASLSVLALLERCGTVRVSDLASAARVDRSVVSRRVKTLESAGLVVSTVDPSDGRVHRLELSDAGRRMLASGRDEVVASVTRHLAGWEPAELDQLTAGLQRLVHDLESDPFTTTDGTSS